MTLSDLKALNDVANKPMEPEEKEALEQADRILDAAQTYLRGNCRLKPIRELINLRLSAGIKAP